MIKKKNEQGFALVLSLVLMLAMSLMGGALIVISASDHQSNNKSDEYQQTFYVAETALLEGEKYLLNQFLGPWNTSSHKRDVTKKNLPSNQTSNFNGQMTKKNYKTSNKFYFNTSNYCFKSFPEIPNDFKVVAAESWNFGDVIRDSFNNNASKTEKDEAERLKGYYYEYFVTRIGSAPFKGSGQSIKKKSGDTGNNGMAYRIFGCGIKAEKHQFSVQKQKHEVTNKTKRMIVALESVIVLPK
tara:strand:+ start:970 stop:1695 length:726 start_codon:yes stop_codon:yes gene_type:complete